VDKATKFIPVWSNGVALRSGHGTMVDGAHCGSRGEKIGKEHLTYAQGASANWSPWPPSLPPTTSGCRFRPPRPHSGVAGTMAANHSGLQLSTIRNIAAAWFSPSAARCSPGRFSGFSAIFAS